MSDHMAPHGSASGPLDPARPDGRCGAKTRAGTPCRTPAGWGTAHPGTGACRKHGGGNFPQQQIRHEQLLAARAVADIAARWEIPDEVTPLDFFAAELRRTAAAVAFLDERVQEHTDTQMVFGTTKVTRSEKDGTSTTVEARPSVWVQLWQTERRHGIAVAKAAAEIGFEDRVVRLEEAKVVLLAQVVEAAIEAGGGDVAAAKRVMAERLRELDA